MGSSKKRKNSHIPGVSNSSLRKDHNSSFLSFLYILLAALFQRISCLFAKLFKDLVVTQEQHNNTHDSNPKVEIEKKDFSKLKDSVVREEDNTDSNLKATSLTEQQKAFELWCYCYKKTYSNQAEKNMRFAIFQKALSPPPPKPQKEHWNNYPNYADLTREELRDSFTYNPPSASYVFPSDMDRTNRSGEYWYVYSSDEERWDEECSDEECWDEDYAQYLRLLEQSSDGTL